MVARPGRITPENIRQQKNQGIIGYVYWCACTLRHGGQPSKARSSFSEWQDGSLDDFMEASLMLLPPSAPGNEASVNFNVGSKYMLIPRYKLYQSIGLQHESMQSYAYMHT